jgi:hypothetical protein
VVLKLGRISNRGRCCDFIANRTSTHLQGNKQEPFDWSVVACVAHKDQWSVLSIYHCLVMVMVLERWNQNGERVVLGDHHMHGPIPREVDVASSRRRLV